MNKLWLGLLVSALASVLSAQDVVRLRTGASVEGTIVSESESAVSIQVDGGTMEVKRAQILEIVRGAPVPESTGDGELASMSHFPEEAMGHFLYRDGHRVGFRILNLGKERRDGVPMYALSDRLVFVKHPGASPEVDVVAKEFVDVSLMPRGFDCRFGSGLTSRTAEGRIEGERLAIVDRSAEGTRERTTHFRADQELMGFSLRRLARDSGHDADRLVHHHFRTRDQVFLETQIERRRDRLLVRGREKEVVVLRQRRGTSSVESWFDPEGRLLREEIGSPRLVSLWAPLEEVQAFARGEAVASGQELELELVSEPAGIRIVRPDHAWELVQGDLDDQLVASFLHARHRATVDVFRLPSRLDGSTLEGLALDVIHRLERSADHLVVDGPRPGAVGDREGLRFTVRCRRRDTEIVTAGAIRKDGDRAYLILGAAPAASFDLALPAILETIASVRVLPDAQSATESEDPFERAAKAVRQ
jgi:hypothetical protein